MVSYSQRILTGGRLVVWQRFARFRAAVAAIREHATPFPVNHLLDIGAADGIGLPFLMPLAKRMLSVNYYANHSTEFSRLHPDDPVITADARALPLHEASQDVVVSFETMHFVPGAAERRKCLREIIRVLRPGGLFICSVAIEIGYPAIIKWVARRCTGHALEGMNLPMLIKHCCHRCTDLDPYDRGRQVGFNAYAFLEDVCQLFDVLATKTLPLPVLFPMNLLIIARRRWRDI